MSFNKFYSSFGLVSPCDGDDTETFSEQQVQDKVDNAVSAAQEEWKASLPVGNSEKKFSQTQLDGFIETRLMKERRGTQAKARVTAEKLESALDNEKIGSDARTLLESQLSDLQGEFQSVEEQAAGEKSKLVSSHTAVIEEKDKELVDSKSRVEKLLSLSKDSAVKLALSSAVVGSDAFSEGQLLAFLGSSVEAEQKKDEKGDDLFGQFTTLVSFQDEDTEGKEIMSKMSPSSAVTRMRELTKRYGNLFNTNLKSGAGASNSTGDLNVPGGNGLLTREQIGALSTPQYKEMKAKYPERLGL